MNFAELLSKIADHYHNNLPFVIYAFPQSPVMKAYFQHDATLHRPTDEFLDGFLMAPFDNAKDTVIIPLAEATACSVTLDLQSLVQEKVVVKETLEDSEAHKGLIKDTINFIKSGNAQKIVAARTKEIGLNNFDIEVLISRLFSSYLPAFRYVWYHPETDLWCGATPEVLVEVKKRHFKTMALAGTQPFHEGQVQWRKKELEEQHFVTEAIIDNLENYVEDVHTSELQTVKAGNLFHLKRDIEGKLKSGNKMLRAVIDILHPTPAVCGTPQEIARDFIIKNERNPRSFYTGYAGPIENGGATANFFVNLRSMKIAGNTATLYVGGGITKDSDVEEEWLETQNKMQTMLHVLKPMLLN